MPFTSARRLLALALVFIFLGNVQPAAPVAYSQAANGRVYLPIANRPSDGSVDSDPGENPLTFTDSFDGGPQTPRAFRSSEWDVAVHSRDSDTWFKLEDMMAQHGPDCGAPPATHRISGAYEDAVYVCKDHVMTAINAKGYGLIYLTPAALVDFSQGEAVIRFDVSTLRTSVRDWADVWISPFEDNLQLPFDRGEVDLQGVPRNAVHVEFGEANGNGTNLIPKIYRNFEESDEFEPFSDDYAWFRGYEQFLTPSSQRRDTFEIRISRTHLKVGMPAYDEWWVDKEIAPLSWTRGVVQFGHHSYNPTKDCNSGSCTANTWHWDNVDITPAIPFQMIKADRRYVTDETNPKVTFERPAPANAYLRFSGIGTIQVSFDGGRSWQAARKQPSSALTDDYHPEHLSSYWLPIAPGARSVSFRFGPDGWYKDDYIAKDFAIWSLSSQ